ncbi:MAG: RluA family pseudouridine synthase [Clostridia bacterium]|nr:RluA family pseudouridine synthase [Clostridia bacterium]
MDIKRKNYKPDKNSVGKEKSDGGEPVPVAKVKLRLDVKDVVRKGDGAAPEDNPLSRNGITLLYEDNHIIVVVKPQNVPSQADSSGDPDMLTVIKQYIAEKYGKPGNVFLGLVHRLDRPTGGVMVFAKTSKAATRLSEQIKSEDGDFEKMYAAVTFGRPYKTGKLEHYLFKDTQTNTVTVVPSTLDGAKKAISEVTLRDEKDGLSFVTVKLVTGRTHQARVQLKAVGAPIIGDRRYSPDKAPKAKNLALWAYKLSFSHPTTGDKMTFLAEPPSEYPWQLFDLVSLTDVIRPQNSSHYFD